jgi:hypothetical protein
MTAMLEDDALIIDFDSTLPPNAAIECLGEVTVPSGTLMFATDFRPHSHHYYAMRQVRSTPTESGMIDVGGARMCVFMTSWGDGIYPVVCDLDENGLLLRVRLELGNLSRQESVEYINRT